MKNLILFYIVIALFLCGSCHRKDSKEPINMVRVQKSNADAQKKDPYMEWNRENVNREDEDIDFFVQRYGWKVEKTGTGLRIEVLEKGSGNLIQPENVVALEYITMLLTGDTIYSSKEMGVKKFKVDKSDEISGLNEAVKKMRKNEVAHLVIPSFLAYGVAGDGNRIKGKVSLAMTIKIIDVE
ncbi:MAG: FKBP-type peptidyl-prolyl cis-trans isomerase [Bacteroidales bacterium]|nr:FKBP-type peptidyl-prolyl cis-trans isomerase [Bacteroidales bacterium]